MGCQGESWAHGETPLRQSHLWKATKLVGRLIRVCKQLTMRHP